MFKGIFKGCFIFSVLVMLLFAGSAFAGDQAAPSTPTVLWQSNGLLVTSPMETGAVGFWFPGDGAFAAGVAHTFLRVSHSAIPKLTLDIDATIAQEVNQDGHTLGGIGAKLGYNVIPPSETGFSFAPSIGITALNDFAKFKTIGDIVGHYRIAVYGTLLLYKW